MRFCSSRQNIGQYIRHLTAGCSYQHTVQNSKEYFEKWIKYLKLKINKMADIVQDYTKNCVPHMFGCPLYIHNNESMLCQTKGCPYAPIHLDAPYVWMPHVFGWLPVCLDAPHMSPSMFGHPHMFGCPLYVWTPPYV